MHDLLRSALLPSLFALLAITGKAQHAPPSGTDAAMRTFRGFHFADPSDSSAFLEFIRDLRPDTGELDVERTPKRFRQVWRISEHGGLSFVSRGEGTELIDREGPVIGNGMFADLAFRTAAGTRGVMRFWEYPCAMICRTTEYYLEE